MTTPETSGREWCWPLFHDWGKWSGVQEGSKWNLLRSVRIEWRYQVRACKRCGCVQERDA